MSFVMYSLFLLGIPVPEKLGKPYAERAELCSRWYPAADELQRRAWLGLVLPAARLASALPDKEICRANVTFASAHTAWVEAQTDMHTDIDHEKWKAWLREAKHLRTFWQEAAATQVEWYDVFAKRQTLADLRRMITQNEWDRHDWPPAAPYWRFKDK